MPESSSHSGSDSSGNGLRHAVNPEKALRVRKRRRSSPSAAAEHLPEPVRKPLPSPEPVPVFIDEPAKRRRLTVIAFGVGAAALAVICWLVGGFFYDAGLNEGMRRGLDAGSVDSQAGGENNDPVFSALLNLRSSKLDRPATELLATLVLDKLRDTTKDRLPGYLKPGHSTVEDFAAAYVAMRLGDFGQAAAILRETEPKIPPDLFKYLMNEPAMREFAREPRVMGFY